MAIFEHGHPFFAEALTYATTQVCLTFAHYLKSDQNLPAKNFILNRGRIVDSILRNTDQVLAALNTKEGPAYLIYDEADASNLQSGGRSPDYRIPPDAWNLISQVCIGSAYERVNSAIRIRYGRDVWKWPRELEYFRHVRNGCFHGNTFDLRPARLRSTAIDPLNPPSWRTSSLQDDTSVQGTIVLGGVLNSGDIPILLGDIAERLQKDNAI